MKQKKNMKKLIIIGALLLGLALQGFAQTDVLSPGMSGVQTRNALNTAFSQTLGVVDTVNETIRIAGVQITANAAEVNILDGALVNVTELNRLVGLSGSIMTLLGAKENSLGNPGTTGYVLSSTTVGVRSWVELGSGGSGKVSVVDSLGHASGNYMSRNSVEDLVNDTILERMAHATVGLTTVDTNTYGGATTRTFVESLLGSGSGLSANTLPFIIGTTSGAPTAADSTVTHVNFAGKHVDVYRDGARGEGLNLQYQNFTATNTVDGFRINGSTITVNPLWQDGEKVRVDIIQPILWSYLSLVGGESSLLTGLSGYWKLDENSGTIINDATGTQNGTTSGSVNVVGKIGMANRIDASSEVITIPYNTNISPKGTAFSVSFWMYLDSVPSATGRDVYPFLQLNNASPYESHSIVLFSANDRVTFYSRNTSGTEYGVISSGALSALTWYHIVAVNRGDGQTLQLYVNGADVSTSAGTFTGTLFEGLSNTYFGNSFPGGTGFVCGKIDEPAIWAIALTAGEVTTLYNSGAGKTHPFN